LSFYLRSDTIFGWGWSEAGLPDGIFSNQNLGKFWMVLQQKILVHFMAIGLILPPFGISCYPLVYLMVVPNLAILV
jgi:hypothetical protein